MVRVVPLLMLVLLPISLASQNQPQAPPIHVTTHLVLFIKTLDPKDRLAIYGLSDTLHVLSDFSSDRDRLLAILKHYDTTFRTNRDEVEPGKWHTPVPGEFNPLLDAQALQLAALTNERRAEATMSALQSITSHVANIPGRKNLVWLTANLPFSGVALARILSPAQIAAYPVDGRALLTRRTPETQWEIDDQRSPQRRGRSRHDRAGRNRQNPSPIG